MNNKKKATTLLKILTCKYFLGKNRTIKKERKREREREKERERERENQTTDTLPSKINRKLPDYR